MIYKIVLLVAAALVGQVVGQSPPCVDDPDFRYNGQSNKDCKYVARRPQMCKKWQVKKNCKETCDYPCECEDGATFDWNGSTKDCLTLNSEKRKRKIARKRAIIHANAKMEQPLIGTVVPRIALR